MSMTSFETPGGADLHLALDPERKAEDDAGVLALHEAGQPETAEGLLRNDQGTHGLGDYREEDHQTRLSFKVNKIILVSHRELLTDSTLV